MYKSPVELIVKQMNTQVEEHILKAIQEVAVDVDKEELIKALQYDRNQYEQGYIDGKLENKWISVNDRLPQDCGDVLVYINRYKQGAIREYYYCGHGEWEDETGWCTTEGFGITHWMPLPEPPNT
jgi:hypothetical protein